jgi:hypothetical protein
MLTRCYVTVTKSVMRRRCCARDQKRPRQLVYVQNQTLINPLTNGQFAVHRVEQRQTIVYLSGGQFTVITRN